MRIVKIGATGTIPADADAIIVTQTSGTITLTMPLAAQRGTKKVTIIRSATCAAAAIRLVSMDAGGAVETLTGSMNNPAVWTAAQRRCSYVVVDKKVAHADELMEVRHGLE